jgi:hypothetical protein
MLPLWIFLAFMGSLVVGSLAANAAGKLPSAEQLQLQDQAGHKKIEGWS